MAKSAKSIEPGVLDELNRLGAARGPIAGWLEGLEAKRESVSEPVYRRVREDYAKRIAELDRLARPLRIEATRAIAALDGELAQLATEKEEVEVDLQEIELRRFLEEYSEAEFEERSQVPRQRLAELGRELEKIRASRELWLAARGEASPAAAEELARETGPSEAPEAPDSPEATQAAGSSPGVSSAPPPMPALAPLDPLDPRTAMPGDVDLRALSPASITMPRPIPPPRPSSPAIAVPPSLAPVAATPASFVPSPPALDHTVVYTPEPPSFFPESPDTSAAGASTLRLQATLVPADAGDGSAGGHVLSPENTIGRVSENSIQIQHGSVSRYHALLRYTAEGWTLEDLEAENGTWVNGERIEKRRLADGDRVNIGTVRFLFKTG